MFNSVSVFIGALVSIMTMVNGTLSASTGNYGALIIIHIVGLLGVVAVMLLCKIRLMGKKGIPIYFYSGGAIGVLTVLFTNISYSGLGVSLPISLGLLGQLLTSLIIDHFGLFNMKKNKLVKKKFIGLAIILSGIILMAVL